MTAMTRTDVEADIHEATIDARWITLVGDALRVERPQPPSVVLPLWHWRAFAPACAPDTAVKVRFLRQIRPGVPAMQHTATQHGFQSVQDLYQGGVRAIQTVVRPLGATLAAVGDYDKPLVDETFDVAGLAALFDLDQHPHAGNVLTALLAAHGMRRRGPNALVAVEFEFACEVRGLPLLHRAARVEPDGRVSLRVGLPGRPPAVLGTAWFGCGPA